MQCKERKLFDIPKQAINKNVVGGILVIIFKLFYILKPYFKMINLLGAISLFPYDKGSKFGDSYGSVANSWILCDGRTLNISEYPALFDLIKTKYGGDGVTTFAIPDLRTYLKPTDKYYNKYNAQRPISPYYFICVQGAAPANYNSDDVEVFLGGLQFFAFDFAPKWFMKCEGQILSMQEHQALFSTLQTKFGGDGYQTFALPDFREVKIAGQSFNCCIASEGRYPERDRADFSGVSSYVAMIIPYAYNFSFATACNGGSLAVENYSAGYSLLGNTFGGDYNKFGLPNIPPIKLKTPNGTAEIKYAISLEGIYPMFD